MIFRPRGITALIVGCPPRRTLHVSTNFGCALLVHKTRRVEQTCSFTLRALIRLRVPDQVCVLPFSPFVHWALNFVYCSWVRTDFAVSMYLVSLASLQPAFWCSVMAASIFAF